MDNFSKHPQWDDVIEICRTLNNRGHMAYLAGGCVRDMILGRTPNDFDVATSASPEQVEACFAKTLPVGKSFGIIVVVAASGPIEVATFRKESEYVDHRHPEAVEFSSPQEDAWRRDFTINGLFYDPLGGEIIDFVGGQEDIKQGLIRTIGSAKDRFDEDYLRVLRAIRFVSQLDFLVEEKTYNMLSHFAPALSSLSQERIQQEMTKLLQGPAVARAIEISESTGLLKTLFPELETMKSESLELWLKTKRSLVLAREIESDQMELSWALLWAHATMLFSAHIAGQGSFTGPTARQKEGRDDSSLPVDGRISKQGEVFQKQLLEQWRFSNKQERKLLSCWQALWMFRQQPDLNGVFLRQIKEPDPRLVLDFLFCFAGAESESEKERWQNWRQQIVSRLGENLVWPDPLIKAAFFVERGVSPGPQLGELLRLCYEQQLDQSWLQVSDADNFVEKIMQEDDKYFLRSTPYPQKEGAENFASNELDGASPENPHPDNPAFWAQFDDTSGFHGYKPSSWRRLGALSIDRLLLASCFFWVVFLVNGGYSGIAQALQHPLSIVSSAVLFAFYEAVMYRLYGATLGKMALGLKLVNAHTGKNLTVMQAIIRSLTRMLEVILSAVPEVIAFYREDRKQLADILAETQVVQEMSRPTLPRPRPVLATFLLLLSLMAAMLQWLDFVLRELKVH